MTEESIKRMKELIEQKKNKGTKKDNYEKLNTKMQGAEKKAKRTRKTGGVFDK